MTTSAREKHGMCVAVLAVCKGGDAFVPVGGCTAPVVTRGGRQHATHRHGGPVQQHQEDGNECPEGTQVATVNLASATVANLRWVAEAEQQLKPGGGSDTRVWVNVRFTTTQNLLCIAVAQHTIKPATRAHKVPESAPDPCDNRSRTRSE